jgi:hypothetical protein
MVHTIYCVSNKNVREKYSTGKTRPEKKKNLVHQRTDTDSFHLVAKSRYLNHMRNELIQICRVNSGEFNGNALGEMIRHSENVIVYIFFQFKSVFYLNE